MPFQFDTEKRRYIKPNGKLVSASEQRATAQRIVDKSAAKLEKLTKQFVDGKISLPQWAAEMREGVRGTHSAMAQYAQGGKAMMGPRERGLLGHQVSQQYAHLNHFVLQVESGQVQPGDAMIARGRMYGEAGFGTYAEQIGQREKDAGATEERSFLEADADHCEECFDEAAKDWSPIGSLIPIGQRTCVTRCQCEFEYR